MSLALFCANLRHYFKIAQKLIKRRIMYIITFLMYIL